MEAGYADAAQKKQIKNGKIDDVFVNKRAGRSVKDAKVHFIDNFQHAAIDATI